MASLSILRFNRTTYKSYYRLLSGVLLFCCSDLLIGVHLFGGIIYILKIDLKGTWVDIVF